MYYTTLQQPHDCLSAPVSGTAVEAGHFILSDQARTQPCGSMLMCSEPPAS